MRLNQCPVYINAEAITAVTAAVPAPPVSELATVVQVGTSWPYKKPFGSSVSL